MVNGNESDVAELLGDCLPTQLIRSEQSRFTFAVDEKRFERLPVLFAQLRPVEATLWQTSSPRPSNVRRAPGRRQHLHRIDGEYHRRAPATSQLGLGRRRSP